MDSPSAPVRGERERPLTLADAFELGFVWRGQLTGQTLEDSRAVGRTLVSETFDGLSLDMSGFNSFQDADLGICDAKRIIIAALLSAQPQPFDRTECLQEVSYRAGLQMGWRYGNRNDRAGYLACIENHRYPSSALAQPQPGAGEGKQGLSAYGARLDRPQMADEGSEPSAAFPGLRVKTSGGYEGVIKSVEMCALIRCDDGQYAIEPVSDVTPLPAPPLNDGPGHEGGGE